MRTQTESKSMSVMHLQIDDMLRTFRPQQLLTMSVPKPSVSATKVAHVLKLQSLDSENKGSGSHDNSKLCLRQWTFSKTHGMAAHVWSPALMY